MYGDGATGRVKTHTSFRHTIRTIHSMDNDFAGVSLNSMGAVGGGAAGTQSLSANKNIMNHAGFSLTATEGSGFAYYTMQLDTQPAVIQRQAGTDPNLGAIFGAGCGDNDVSTDGWQGVSTGDYYKDNSALTRTEACGTVEPPESYWVDVTVTQTIHVDLATPPVRPYPPAPL